MNRKRVLCMDLNPHQKPHYQQSILFNATFKKLRMNATIHDEQNTKIGNKEHQTGWVWGEA